MHFSQENIKDNLKEKKMSVKKVVLTSIISNKCRVSSVFCVWNGGAITGAWWPRGNSIHVKEHGTGMDQLPCSI